jgi:hypothetical protein
MRVPESHVTRSCTGNIYLNLPDSQWLIRNQKR